MKVIIAAAGTGGHINPGIAIANRIKKDNKNCQITFIGTNRGLENDLVPKAGYDLKTIEAYGINRKINIQNIKNMFKTLRGYKVAKKIVKEYKPDIVIGTGGYICGPVLKAAQSLDIPTVLHESNAFPGAAVKLLCKKTDLVLAGFEDTKKRLPKAKKVVVTGTPTKVKEIHFTKQQKDELIKQLDLKNDIPIVLIFGGSQGAKSINTALIEIIRNKLNENYQIIWATGPKQYDVVKNILKENSININKIEKMKILPYIYNMEEIMNLSDIIIARSGAMTITEISNLGKPSILIPLPNVSQDHQLYNAKVLEDVGAAKIILNNELTKDNLNKEIETIIRNPEQMKKMEEKALSKSVENVQEKIYKEISKVIKGC